MEDPKSWATATCWSLALRDTQVVDYHCTYPFLGDVPRQVSHVISSYVAWGRCTCFCDRDSYDCDSYDRDSYDRDSYDLDSYDLDSYDRVSYDRVSCDRVSYDRVSYDRVSCDRVSYDRVSCDRVSCDRVSYDRVPCDRVSCDRVSYDRISIGIMTALHYVVAVGLHVLFSVKESNALINSKHICICINKIVIRSY
jgi:hypothetical protein